MIYRHVGIEVDRHGVELEGNVLMPGQHMVRFAPVREGHVARSDMKGGEGGKTRIKAKHQPL